MSLRPVQPLPIQVRDGAYTVAEEPPNGADLVMQLYLNVLSTLKSIFALKESQLTLPISRLRAGKTTFKPKPTSRAQSASKNRREAIRLHWACWAAFLPLRNFRNNNSIIILTQHLALSQLPGRDQRLAVY